jgi:sulfide:quinone oxidoreductase
MIEPRHNISGRVVIVGGGVAGLEALLALRSLAGERVELTLVSPSDWFIDRPMAVAEPFGFGSPVRLSLPSLAAESGAEFVRGSVTAVDGASRRLSCSDGREVAFDTLVLAPGARARTPFTDAITFGFEGSGQAIRDMLAALRGGDARSVAFVAPAATGWLLPLYEIALMTSRELARSRVEGVELRLLTPEDGPLALFGEDLSHGIGRLLETAGIHSLHASFAKLGEGGLMYGAIGQASTDYVVTLPLLSGPGLAGVPAGEDGFIPVDEYGRVTGLEDVYAAGDAIDFPVKQGGLAAQQADSVAEHVAARYGANVEPAPFRPALRGMLFSGDDPFYMRSDVPGADPDIPGAWYPLWWPPTKVAGRYLPPYLFERGDEDRLGFPPGPPVGFIDVDVPLVEMTLPG